MPASLQLWHWGSVVGAHGFNCTGAGGILISQPGIEPMSPALEGVFLTPEPPGKFQNMIF